MTREEYLESQRGKTYTEILAEQPLEGAIGSIRGENLRDVVAVLAGGLQHRLDNMSLPTGYEPLRTALLVAFKYLTIQDYAINLSLEENVTMLQMAVAVGLVTQAESNKFFELATYTMPKFNITRQECADYFNPGWYQLDPTHNRSFTVEVTEQLPEQSTIVVQYQEIYEGWESAWKPATSLIVHQPGKYRADTPYNGYERRFQWRCEYQLTGNVAVL